MLAEMPKRWSPARPIAARASLAEVDPKPSNFVRGIAVRHGGKRTSAGPLAHHWLARPQRGLQSRISATTAAPPGETRGAPSVSRRKRILQPGFCSSDARMSALAPPFAPSARPRPETARDRMRETQRTRRDTTSRNGQKPLTRRLPATLERDRGDGCTFHRSRPCRRPR